MMIASNIALKKYEPLEEFGGTLPRLLRWIASRHAEDIGDFETAIAAVLALIDRGYLRVGNTPYEMENGSFGATTLQNRYIAFDGSKGLLNHVGKCGNRTRKSVQGEQLQHVLQRSRD